MYFKTGVSAFKNIESSHIFEVRFPDLRTYHVSIIGSNIFNMKISTLACLLVMFPLGTFALVSDFQFTTSTSTYTPNSGATVIATGAVTNQTYSGMPIGFTFYYNGQSFTRFSLNVNGFIGLGDTPVVNTGSPLNSGTSNNVISAMGCYLKGNTGAQISYKTIGSYPNRVLVAEWSNFKLSISTNGNLNFQIRLEENTNRIIFHYGLNTEYYLSYCEVGIRGSSNNDYVNRQTSSNWSSTTPGTHPGSTCAIGHSSCPANGLMFLFNKCIPPAITGPVFACVNTGTSIYTTAQGMSNYTWTVTGGTIVSGDTSNLIQVSWGSPGVQSVTVNYTTPTGCVFTQPVSVTVNVVENARPLTISVFPESLYSGGSFLRKAQNAISDQFGDSIADLVRVELRNGSDYSIVVFAGDNISLKTNGSIWVAVPQDSTNSYYITVKHRNSLETSSSIPVAFNLPEVSYSFDVPSKSFGNTLKSVFNKYCICGGDVLKDNLIDVSDMILIDNLSRIFSTGYIPEDANGDGLIDCGDMIIVDNNARNFEQAVLPYVPAVLTSPVSNIGPYSVTCSGSVTDEGFSTVTERGFCWNTSPYPSLNTSHLAVGNGTGAFTANLTNLSSNTVFYMRAYATNSLGTAYGNTVVFKTNGLLMDYDSNIYLTVTIGTQDWMAENLKVTHYRNGVSITYPGTDNITWNTTTQGAYAYLSNDSTWKNIYGALYNWYAVSDPNGLCPEGWHVPTYGEYEVLMNYVGGSYEGAGGKLKSTRKSPSPHPRWSSPNFGATNESGFNGYPGGLRYPEGGFSGQGYDGWFWTSTPYNSSYAYNKHLYYNSIEFSGNAPGYHYGESVRCIKD